MAQFTRLELAKIMKDTGMVPLFYNLKTKKPAYEQVFCS